MTAADSPLAISVFRFRMPPKKWKALSSQCSSISGASNFGVRDNHFSPTHTCVKNPNVATTAVSALKIKGPSVTG